MDNEEEKEGTSTADTHPAPSLQKNPFFDRCTRRGSHDQTDQHDDTKNPVIHHHKAHVVVSNVRMHSKENQSSHRRMNLKGIIWRFLNKQTKRKRHPLTYLPIPTSCQPG